MGYCDAAQASATPTRFGTHRTARNTCNPAKPMKRWPAAEDPAVQRFEGERRFAMPAGELWPKLSDAAFLAGFVPDPAPAARSTPSVRASHLSAAPWM